MRKFVILCLGICLMVTGCGKKKQESVPIVSDEDMQIEQAAEDNGDMQRPELDSKLSSFEFSVQGEEYTLPLAVQELTEDGWNYTGDMAEEIEGESFVENREMSLEDLTFQIDIANFSAEKETIEQCYIGRILLQEESDSLVIGLPGDIVLGEATVSQAERAYNAPSDRFEDDREIILTYEFGVYKKAILTFDSREGILRSAELTNQTDPREEEELENLNTGSTPEVEEYEAPLVLADDFMEFTVEYDGNYYRLPAPVRAFIDNGWEIDEESSDGAVKSGKYGYVTLLRGERKLYALVYNYGSEAAVIQNCFVTTVYGDLTATKIPIRVAHDITLGMSREDYLTAIEGLTWEQKEDEKLRTITYTFYLNEDKLDYTEIKIDLDLDMVSSISLVHYKSMGEEDSREAFRLQEDEGE